MGMLCFCAQAQNRLIKAKYAWQSLVKYYFQDGSCNGLQHYAALGRDKGGAEAVNLAPFDKPQDVYSDVLIQVMLDKSMLDKSCVLL